MIESYGILTTSAHDGTAALTYPPEVLKLFAFDKDDEIRRIVASNPASPAELLSTLFAPLIFVDLDHMFSEGSYVGDGCPEVVMANPSLPEWMLDYMVPEITERDVKVRRRVAHYPDSPAVVLDQLAYDRDWQVRSIVARHKNTPPEAFEQLARDSVSEVRENVAKNKACPTSTLESLALDPAADIRHRARIRLVHRESCPPLAA